MTPDAITVCIGMGLRIGTSGWSYPTGNGKWNVSSTRPPGPSERKWPTSCTPSAAEHFDTVEVNSTFYMGSHDLRSRKRGWNVLLRASSFR